MPIRFDVGRIDGPQITEQGYLKADAFPTRAGIFLYMNADGTIRRELRHPDEVFKAESMSTLTDLVLTRDHPVQPLTSKNTKQYAVGFSGPSPKKVGEHIGTKITVYEDAAIQDVVSGERQELSCGYFCDVDFTPGVWNGLEYDAAQKNIRYNHIALVNKGRAGPTAKVKLDSMRFDGAESDGAVMVTDAKEKSSGEGNENPVVSKTEKQDTNKKLEKTMPFKFTIDSLEYEVQDAATAQAIVRKLDAGKKAEEELEKEKKEKEGLKGKADALEADNKAKADEIAKLKADAGQKMTDKEIMAKADALIKVRDFGKKVLGEQAKVDEMDVAGIKKAVVSKLVPGIKADEKSVEYIDAAFDIQLSLDSKAAGDPVRKAIQDRAEHGAGSNPSSAEARAARMKKDADDFKNYKGYGTRQ